MTNNSHNRLWLAIGLMVIGGVGFGLYFAYRSVSSALWAERNLHTMGYVVRLIDGFVTERGHWPKSWKELEEFPYQELRWGERWPDCASDVKQRTIINFAPDLKLIVVQDAMQFDAIKPIGPTFEWRDNGEVKKLQLSVLNKIPIQ